MYSEMWRGPMLCRLYWCGVDLRVQPVSGFGGSVLRGTSVVQVAVRLMLIGGQVSVSHASRCHIVIVVIVVNGIQVSVDGATRETEKQSTVLNTEQCNVP